MRQEPPFDTWDPPLVVPVIDTTGAPVWPDKFDPNLEANTADDTWATEYMLHPLPPHSLVFPPERTNWTRETPAMRVKIGVDPATGDGSDRCGIVAAGIHAGGLFLLDAVCWSGDGDDIPGEVVAMIGRLEAAGHTVDGVAVEAVGGFRFVARRVSEAVYPITSSHGKPRQSKLERAQELARWHEAGAVWFTEGLRGSPLDVEFHSWNRHGQTVTGHDDMPDAAIWAARTATDGWRV